MDIMPLETTLNLYVLHTKMADAQICEVEVTLAPLNIRDIK
jgi:hypothetical protein